MARIAGIVLTALAALATMAVLSTGAAVGAETESKSSGAKSVASVECGKPAPAFKLPDSRGKTRKLADFRGKYVILEWVNFGCPFVRKHYDSHNMQDLQKFAGDKGAVWLSICSSAPGKQGNMTAAEINKLIQEKGAQPTAYLLDKDGKTGIAYGARTTPHMYIIDPKGVLIYQGAIDDKASTDKEDVPSAKNYVKSALLESMAGKPVAVSTTRSYGCSVKY